MGKKKKQEKNNQCTFDRLKFRLGGQQLAGNGLLLFNDLLVWIELPWRPPGKSGDAHLSLWVSLFQRHCESLDAGEFGRKALRDGSRAGDETSAKLKAGFISLFKKEESYLITIFYKGMSLRILWGNDGRYRMRRIFPFSIFFFCATSGHSISWPITKFYSIETHHLIGGQPVTLPLIRSFRLFTEKNAKYFTITPPYRFNGDLDNCHQRQKTTSYFTCHGSSLLG